MNHEIEDCLIRLENQMYGFGGVSGRSASGDRYAVEEYIRDVDGYERDARRDVVQKDARIAELTAEVARLRVAVTQGYEEGFKAGIQYQAAEDDIGLDYWTAWKKSAARNALREG